MELEFDKEIDAILRRSRGSVAVNSVTTPHLDADGIAAFSENALPQATKLLFTRHLADCDNCRKKLSLAIRINTGADATAAPSAAVPAVGTTIPWYSKILRSPSIAIAMGALVLAFVGVLGFLIVQNRNAGVDVSQVQEERPKSAPTYEAPSSAANANSATNASAANAAANVSADGLVEPNTPNTRGGHGAAEIPAPLATPAEGFVVGGADQDTAAKSATVTAPSAPIAQSAPRPEERSDEAEKLKEESNERKRSKSDYEERLARDAPPAPLKKAGPNRAAGPRQSNQTLNQNQTQDMVTGDSVLANKTFGGAPASVKNAGGKKFQFRNGAWYDTSYSGQATKNVSRSSAEFGKLDAGLRGIANTVGGVVVIVWKGSAYRIQ